MDDTSALGASLEECRAAKSTQEDVEVVARAVADNPDIFSDDTHVAHRAASPIIVEVARERARRRARAALAAIPSRTGKNADLLFAALEEANLLFCRASEAASLEEASDIASTGLARSSVTLAQCETSRTVPSEVVEKVIAAARKMPRATPGPGGAGTRHVFLIPAHDVWALDVALEKLDAALGNREEVK